MTDHLLNTRVILKSLGTQLVGASHLLRGGEGVPKGYWKAFYDSTSELARQFLPSVRFMNIGYTDPSLSREPPPLGDCGELERLPAQLYYVTATGHGSLALTGKDVLEVGAGRGGGARYMAGALGARSVVALDLSSAAVGDCRRTFQGISNLRFEQGDAEQLPFAAESFDLLVSVESSHCYPDFARFVREAARVLRPGGHLVLSDGRHGAPGFEPVIAAFDGCGFEMVQREDITDGVLEAVALDQARKVDLLQNAQVPFLVRWQLKLMMVDEDTFIVRLFKVQKSRYLRFCLRKPAPTSAPDASTN